MVFILKKNSRTGRKIRYDQSMIHFFFKVYHSKVHSILNHDIYLYICAESEGPTKVLRTIYENFPYPKQTL